MALEVLLANWPEDQHGEPLKRDEATNLLYSKLDNVTEEEWDLIYDKYMGWCDNWGSASDFANAAIVNLVRNENPNTSLMHLGTSERPVLMTAAANSDDPPEVHAMLGTLLMGRLMSSHSKGVVSWSSEDDEDDAGNKKKTKATVSAA